MNGYKISWITPSCYVDVDLPIVNQLRKDYDINWIVVLEPNSSDDVIKYIEDVIKDRKGIQIDYRIQYHRLRSLKNLSFVYNIIKAAKKTKPSVIYTSEYAMPYGLVLYKMFLPLKKTVAACHNVTTPKGANNEHFAKFYTDRWLKTFLNIQTFSKSQCNVLISKYTGKNVLMSYLAIKDYGEPTISYDNSIKTINFLMFGNIVGYKRVDLLLDAVNILVERGITNFKVTIAGNCKESWENIYQPRIKYPQYFNLLLKRIPNEDVANLFEQSHYFVMPYQDIAQSGAITVAFRYNIPVICSDIEQFKEFVNDGVTGYMFKSQDAISLADKMEWVIKNHATNYDMIRQNEQFFVNDNLSLSSIVNKYKLFFDDLCKSQN